MKIIKSILMATLVLLAASCASTYKAKVGFDKNTNVDTTSYKTFAWLTPDKIMAPAEDFNPVMKFRVDEAIEKAFIGKGYTLVKDAEKADFTVSYTVGNRDKIKVSSYPSAYSAHFGWGRHYYRSMFGRNMRDEVTVRQYTEGKLAIDVYDVKLRQPAWHGWATKRIRSNDKEGTPSIVKNTVNEVVSQFN